MAASSKKPFLRPVQRGGPWGRRGYALGIIDFYRTPTYHMKEIVSKFSEFEKPYEGGGFQEMQLPTWEIRYPPWDPVGGGAPPKAWEPSSPDRGFGCFYPECYDINVFDDGTNCDRELGATVDGMVCVWGGGGTLTWDIWSSDPLLAEVIVDEPTTFPPFPSTDFKVRTKDVDTGEGTETVSICGRLVPSAAFVAGGVLPPQTPGNWGYQVYEPTSYYGKFALECGCTEIEIDCTSCDEAAVISYTTLSMRTSEEQELSADLSGTYTWSTDYGSLSSEATAPGEVTTLTAPSANAGCTDNPTVKLYCEGVEIDSILIVVYRYANATWNACPYDATVGELCDCENVGTGYATCRIQVGCDGTFILHARDCCELGDGCDENDFPFETAEGLACATSLGITLGANQCCGGEGGVPNECREWCDLENTFTDSRTEDMITWGCCPHQAYL